MKWNLKMIDPSGETRKLPLEDLRINLTQHLRDASLPHVSIEIEKFITDDTSLKPMQSPFWLRVIGSQPLVRMGGSLFHEGQIPLHIPFRIGETELSLFQTLPQVRLPEFPTGYQPWYTCTDEGKKILWNLKKVAATPLSIYLAGETGIGKEVLAGLTHAWSDRAPGPYITINCGALSSSLAESELFGHVKGAFTGAHRDRPGALLQAHGGTLFLDEVGDLSLDLQAKLLRFLENGELRALGSDRVLHASTRVICATHKSLLALIEQGLFRRDLYFRIASVTVDIPALREREPDISLLAEHFAESMGKQISPAAILRLQAYSWPGNVRELRHSVERACGLASPFQPHLDACDFDFLLHSETMTQTPELSLGAGVLTMKEMEKAMLLKALRMSQGNRGEAAKILGIARSTLFDMLRRYKIIGPRSQYRSAENHFREKYAFNTAIG